MTNSPDSSSDVSISFTNLDPRIQRWIWGSGWQELREAQEWAIPLLLEGRKDVIIAASTASGKTEAAFFPILTRLAALMQDEEATPGLAIYVSPLKALINDQWRRLDELAGLLEIPVTPWHGDVPQTRKTRFLKAPSGCLLITPESLEALLMRHGHGLSGILAGLRYVVVDELHAFMGTERGKQLQSLLHRIEKALDRTVCRVGLSATLGDMNGASDFLRPGTGGDVAVLVARDDHQELRVLFKGYEELAVLKNESLAHPEADAESFAKLAIASHLYGALRGSNNLVFPNRRSEVEYFADRLRARCDHERVPNEFWPHHGSLSKEIREETEAALKGKERPASAICTTTLELGIDIGAVKSVAQIGAPPSVAALRQRLGRSGRRKGEPAILRGYVLESQLVAKSSLSDQLREGLVQSVAMVRLLVARWYEPIVANALHASTLVQQVLSSLAQHGGMHAGDLWTYLCGTGPFDALSREQFLDLLRALGTQEILFQDPTGLLLLAPKGERFTEHYSFYAAFSADDEYRIVTSGRTLGSMPIAAPLAVGSHVIFAGRRWRVLNVAMEDLVIEVEPAAGGVVPRFIGGGSAAVHERVREEMRQVLRESLPIPFLDEPAQSLLREARETYARLGLDRTCIRRNGGSTEFVPWKGDRVQNTLVLLLQGLGLQGMNEGLIVSIENSTVDEVRQALARLHANFPSDPVAVAVHVENKVREKWDFLLPPSLLDATFASREIDLPGAKIMLSSILEAGITASR